MLLRPISVRVLCYAPQLNSPYITGPRRFLDQLLFRNENDLSPVLYFWRFQIIIYTYRSLYSYSLLKFESFLVFYYVEDLYCNICQCAAALYGPKVVSGSLGACASDPILLKSCNLMRSFEAHISLWSDYLLSRRGHRIYRFHVYI